MLYLNEKDLQMIGINWKENVNVIKKAVFALKENDYSQPIKPYLKYGNPNNRIIAMPAYIGGNISTAGIKWIASFPENISKGKLRANSVTILNDAETGEPISVINTSMISAIRTASVSGLMVEKFLDIKDVEGQEHGPIEVAILAAFLIYRYKFLSQAKDKNLYRLPYWTRTCSYCRLGVYLIVILPFNSLN